jgi:hypothetical protein
MTPHELANAKPKYEINACREVENFGEMTQLGRLAVPVSSAKALRLGDFDLALQDANHPNGEVISRMDDNRRPQPIGFLGRQRRHHAKCE